MPGGSNPKPEEQLPVWQIWSDPSRTTEPVVYEAPEPEPHSDERALAEKPPQDYIMCMNRHPRLVAACMKNCPLPHYCPKFHGFFSERGLTPIQYFNRDGIGAQAMRRIVFDCDRCGKRDVAQVYSRYSREGESEEHLLGMEERAAMIEQTGYGHDDLGQIVFSLLSELEQQKGWVHYCDKCFGKIIDSLAQIMNVRKTKVQAQARQPSSPARVAGLPSPPRLKKVAAAG